MRSKGLLYRRRLEEEEAEVEVGESGEAAVVEGELEHRELIASMFPLTLRKLQMQLPKYHQHLHSTQWLRAKFLRSVRS